MKPAFTLRRILQPSPIMNPKFTKIGNMYINLNAIMYASVQAAEEHPADSMPGGAQAYTSPRRVLVTFVGGDKAKSFPENEGDELIAALEKLRS